MTLDRTILTTMLAREFGRELAKCLSPAEMATANERNAFRSWHTGICHSHDYCDANMAMAAAFERVVFRPILPDDHEPDEADCALWSDAWNLAARHRFWADPHEAQFQTWRQTMKPCADLGAEFDDEAWQGVPGLLYEGGYIAEPPGGIDGKRWHLIIERSEWWTNDLEELERILFFEWVLPEGYLDVAVAS